MHELTLMDAVIIRVYDDQPTKVLKPVDEYTEDEIAESALFECAREAALVGKVQRHGELAVHPPDEFGNCDVFIGGQRIVAEDPDL